MTPAPATQPLSDHRRPASAHLIERYGQIVTNIEKGDPRDGTMKYLGRVKRPEFDAEVEAVHQQSIPPNERSRVAQGRPALVVLRRGHGLPVLVVTHDPDGEVEYYCHDHIQGPCGSTTTTSIPIGCGGSSRSWISVQPF